MRRLSNKSGFSLVELMIVVAIIGVLATMAVPTYRRMIARAKKSEAKIALGGIYTVEQAFEAEYSTYGTNLRALGFQLQTGAPVYTVGFVDGACAPLAIFPANVPGSDFNIRNANYFTMAYDARFGRNQAGMTCNGNAGEIATATAATFRATATGAISNGVANNAVVTVAGCNAGACQDSWTIDEQRNLRNVVDGSSI